MTNFSTNESICLERKLDEARGEVAVTSDEDIDGKYEIERCTKWVAEGGYKKVCLQFPDFMLPDSTKVALKLQDILRQTVYILGDTSYESCCLDYVAAAHVGADAIVHFGPKCFSKPSGDIPHLYVYEKHAIDLEALERSFSEAFSEDKGAVLLLLNTPFMHVREKVEEILGRRAVVRNIEDEIGGDFERVLYVGANDRKLMNLHFRYKSKELYVYDVRPPNKIANYVMDSRILKRRHFLIEKIKDSRTVGIIVGTLAVKNYLKIIERVKLLLKLNSKKYYLISVGKPTPAKLANIPELDVNVLISCSMNELYDDRDFYIPIVTPYDIEAALNPNFANVDFSFDFNILPTDVHETKELEDAIASKPADISLLTGCVRGVVDVVKNVESENSVAVRDPGILITSDAHGAGYLAQRSWKGLEPKLGQSEVKLAQEGRKGVARGYTGEMES